MSQTDSEQVTSHVWGRGGSDTRLLMTLWHHPQGATAAAVTIDQRQSSDGNFVGEKRLSTKTTLRTLDVQDAQGQQEKSQ